MSWHMIDGCYSYLLYTNSPVGSHILKDSWPAKLANVFVYIYFDDIYLYITVYS